MFGSIAFSLIMAASSVGAIDGGVNATQGAVRIAHKPTAVLWVHGGGWVGGSPTDNPLPRHMAHEIWPDAVHVDVVYPLGVGAYPANLQSVQTAIDIAVQSQAYSRVVVVGYSAGGFLSLAADTHLVESVIVFGAPSSLGAFRQRDPQTAEIIRLVFGSTEVPWGWTSRNLIRVCGITDTDVTPDVCSPGHGKLVWTWGNHAFLEPQTIAQVYAGV